MPMLFKDPLTDKGWLGFLSTPRSLLFKLDRKGRPLWAANRQSHEWNHLIDHLFSSTVFDHYELPVKNDLNLLFDDCNLAPEVREKENHLELLKQKGPAAYGLFPRFPSRNFYDAAALCPFFITDLPLTSILLFRENRELFLALIRISGLIQTSIRLNENRNLLLVGPDNNIRGYSALFASPLLLSDPRELLGRPFLSILSLNIPAGSPPRGRDPLSYEPEVAWKPGLPQPFQRSRFGASVIKTDSTGLFWRNHGSTYSYLKLNTPFNTDRSNFVIETSFTRDKGKIPNLIIRGIGFDKSPSPDMLGYSVTNLEGETGCRFRKSGVNVKFLAFQDPVSDDGLSTLRIVKTGGSFSFFLDQKLLGTYVENAPYRLPSENLVYLFLRPGEKLHLASFHISSIPLMEPEPASRSVEASLLYGSAGRQYSAAAEECTHDNRNFVLWELTDITPFKDNIRKLEHERDRLSGLLEKPGAFLGRSPSILRIREEAHRVAGSSLSVLIEGETGSGKEVLAREIHVLSPRKNGPFIKIDCSTMPLSLIESELFGHEKGAFTGALSSRPGLFEQADGGTVFLDEISNLPLTIQAKLLGVLESNEVRRVGGVKPVRLDFRLIGATNIPLRLLIDQGRFRPDLYYRLNQHCFQLPPLRDRLEDLPDLALEFLKEAAVTHQKEVSGFSRGAMARLFAHRYPGNVRELKNAVLRAALFANGATVEDSDILLDPPALAPSGSAAPGTLRRRRRITAEQITAAFSSAAGNAAHASELLGISRSKLYRLIKAFALDPDQLRP